MRRGKRRVRSEQRLLPERPKSRPSIVPGSTDCLFRCLYQQPECIGSPHGITRGTVRKRLGLSCGARGEIYNKAARLLRHAVPNHAIGRHSPSRWRQENRWRRKKRNGAGRMETCICNNVGSTPQNPLCLGSARFLCRLRDKMVEPLCGSLLHALRLIPVVVLTAAARTPLALDARLRWAPLPASRSQCLRH